ncbi:regulatory protein, TetR [Anaerovibrio sp. JC8]|uniref:TetR/AcrR family transcriptional regulator n=1 Tax=Anaerovibrio sp. JC8 TaxID=1240085 RepID=UPI000A0D9D8E|nr:TetR/AcrR family transcriptional regulator [Anaerovibrio sp. JC8]ORU00637.1 regulatory protein, TetR [Anaerovibrio sp. JC8]
MGEINSEKICHEARGDGNETKALLIETAGKLIAQKGYEKTTSKEICGVAKVNVAAINYHFGGRDKLYIAVLERVHEYLLNVRELEALEESKSSTEEEISIFLDILTNMVMQKDNWPIRVWIREITAPSGLTKKIVSEKAVPKLKLMLSILGNYTGLSRESPLLSSCLISVLAPFVWFLLVERSELQELREIVPIDYENSQVPKNFKKFVLAGLQGFKVNK